jgi:hypothetical protein
MSHVTASGHGERRPALHHPRPPDTPATSEFVDAALSGPLKLDHLAAEEQ